MLNLSWLTSYDVDMHKNQIRNYLPLILLSTWIFLLLALMLIVQETALSEMWTRTFSRFIQQFLGPIFNLFPLSLAEWIFGITLIYLIAVLMKGFKLALHQHWKKAFMKLLKVVNIVGCTLTFYFATAGIAYQRADLPFILHQQNVETNRFDDIIQYFINDYNDTASRLNFDDDGNLISPYTLQEVNQILKDEFLKLDDEYFTPFTPQVKPMVSAWLFTEFNITGVSIAITTEAMINQLVPWSSIPFTMAHELAHAKGVMREEDANLVALYITLQSQNDFIRYSGYFSSFNSLLNLSNYTNIPNHRQTLIALLNPIIRSNYQAYSRFWQNYQWLNELARTVNDFYLRILGNEGVSSYNDQEETETIEENGEPVEIIVSFSPYQRLYFLKYFNA